MNRFGFLMIVMSVVAVSACSTVKRELGVGRQSPDEFTVVKRAPLSLPPGYELRAPQSGTAPSPLQTQQQARAALMGPEDGVPQAGDADTVFLQQLGADRADPAIREQITKDNGLVTLRNQSVVDKLIFWEDEGAPAKVKGPTSVVDPGAESERLRQNMETGRPVNEGDVPVIEKKPSTIDRLFDTVQ